MKNITKPIPDIWDNTDNLTLDERRRLKSERHVLHLQQQIERYIKSPLGVLEEYRQKCKERYSIELAMDYATFREIDMLPTTSDDESTLIYQYLIAIDDEFARRDHTIK